MPNIYIFGKLRTGRLPSRSYPKLIIKKLLTYLKTAKQNYPGSVASYDTRSGNEVGLFYNDNTHGPRNPHGAPAHQLSHLFITTAPIHIHTK